MSRPNLTLANLTDSREAAFVAALFELGGPQHGAVAPVRAGYAENLEDAARAAAFLLSSSRISRVVTGEVRARFDVATAAAFNTLLEVCADRSATGAARISAAQAILDRSSIGPVPSRTMSLTAAVTVEDLLAKLDAAKGDAGDVVDGEFTDVTPIAPGDDS